MGLALSVVTVGWPAQAGGPPFRPMAPEFRITDLSGAHGAVRTHGLAHRPIT